MLKIQAIEHRAKINQIMGKTIKLGEDNELRSARDKKLATFTSGFKSNQLRTIPKRTKSSLLEEKNYIKTLDFPPVISSQLASTLEKSNTSRDGFGIKKSSCEISTQQFENRINNTYLIRHLRKNKSKAHDKYKGNYRTLQNKRCSQQKSLNEENSNLKIIAEKIGAIQDDFELSPMRMYRRKLKSFDQISPKFNDIKTIFEMVKNNNKIVKEKRDPALEISPWDVYTEANLL